MGYWNESGGRESGGPYNSCPETQSSFIFRALFLGYEKRKECTWLYFMDWS